MTPRQFRAAHGDPGDWCGPEIDEYLDYCLAGLPAPAMTSKPEAQAAAEQIVHTLAIDVANAAQTGGNPTLTAQFAAVIDLANLVDQTPGR